MTTTLTRSQRLDQLEEHVRRRLRSGTRPRVSDLLEFARKLSLSEKDVRRVRNRVSSLGVLTAPVSKVRAHFGNVYPTLGQVQMDFAEFRKNWRVQNGQRVGFILAVDVLTTKLYVTPVTGKKSSDWERAVEEMVTQPPGISKIVSDRDAAVTSRTFRDRISERYHVEWDFILSREKAYYAELFIGLVKSDLSVLCRERDTKRWVDLVPTLVRDRNERLVPGTQFSPSQVTWENVDQFVRQRYADPNFDRSYNINAINALPIASREKIFTFRVGERVRIDRRTHPYAPERRKAVGDKPSVHGSFTDKTYVVSDRALLYVPRRGYQQAYYVFDPEKKRSLPVTFYAQNLKSASSAAPGDGLEEAVGAGE